MDKTSMEGGKGFGFDFVFLRRSQGALISGVLAHGFKPRGIEAALFDSHPHIFAHICRSG